MLPKAAVKVKKKLGKIKRWLGNKPGQMKFVYAWHLRHSAVKPDRVLFESFHGRDLSDSPFYILKSLMETGEADRYEIWFATMDMARHKAQAEALGLKVKLVDVNSFAYTKVMATAAYLINNSSFPAWFIRRPGQVYLQTWHGTPLKTLGKKMRLGIESMYNVQHNFLQASYIMFPNEFTRDAMMGDYNLNELYTGKVVLSGYPRNSIFSHPELGLAVRESLGNSGFTTLAYMPTWRGQSNHDIHLEDYGQTVNGMLREIDGALTDSQKLYVNFHPIVQQAVSLDSYRHILPFPEGVDKYEFLNSVDALITDYSSVFFDFSITGKPVILFMYDYEEYMAERGMYFDIRELPFRKIYELDDLIECLRTESFRADDYKDDRYYTDRFIRYDGPDTGSKMADLVFHGESGDMPVQDYSANAKKRWRVRWPANLDTPEKMDALLAKADPDNELIVFEKNLFTPELSAHLCDHYADDYTFLFLTGTNPRTLIEEALSRVSASVRRRIHMRNIDRCFPGLNIDPNFIRDSFSGEPKAALEKIRCRGSRLDLVIKLPADGLTVKELRLTLRNDLRNERISLPFVEARRGNEYILTCRADMNDYSLEPIYWDLAVVVEQSGGGRQDETKAAGSDHLASADSRACLSECGNEAQPGSPAEVLLPVHTSGLQRKAFSVGDYVCRLKGGFIFFPYREKLAFIFRKGTKYDGAGQRLKEIAAAVVYFLGRPIWKRKRIWIIYEKFCAAAQDNGWYFFEYCMKELPEAERKHIFYVMDPASPEWERTEPYRKQILPFMSFKYMVYTVAVRVYASSDVISHLYVWQARPNLISAAARRKPFVFLQHGVTAFKRVHNLFHRQYLGEKSSFVTTSAFEQKIVTENFGYTPENAPILGFCRWDVFHDKASADDRFILIMPTWRNWLEDCTAEDFTASEYYRRYMALLGSERLRRCAETCGFRLVFYLHPKLGEQLGEFKADPGYVELVPFGSRPLNEIIMRCHMLITDYSSVSWDAFYLGKPVLFYQFDTEEYKRAHGGSYIDFEKDLFGDRYTDEEALIAGIEEYASGGFREKAVYADRRPDLFAFRDDRNSARTYAYMIKKGY